MGTNEAIFHKYEACGNDYLVIPSGQKWFKYDQNLIRKICSTQYGAGSDGILWAMNSKESALDLRIFNPDGSEAEKSGNGLRIYARYLADHGLWKKEELKARTLGGEVILKKINSGVFSVNMGLASFEPKDIPLNDIGPWINKEIEINELKFVVTCLSMGNPHCVIETRELPSDSEVRSIGPVIENYPLFSNRINVQFVKILNSAELEIKIWERGAGLTESSGSSSCAAAYAMHYLGKLKKTSRVKMKGGILEVNITENGLWLTGPVNKIFTGTFSEEFLRNETI